MLTWARERASLTIPSLAKKFPKLAEWEVGPARPTLKQLEAYAKATHAPIGFFFLEEPPKERVPIPDFRTVANARIDRPSPELLDTVYICQQRQEWFRDFARSVQMDPLTFVGSVTLQRAPAEVAPLLRHALGFDVLERRQIPTWVDALRQFIEQADAVGVLVMCSGVVLNNNRRRLDPDEFRGFAMSDPLAPLVFVNGADTKAGQMFTLAHELAHIWLGQSGVSDMDAAHVPDNEIERWCNQVAAELLVPLADLQRDYNPTADLHEETQRLARLFKVSTLVILRRIRDAGGLTWEELWAASDEELARLLALARGSGGDFYLTQAARVGKRFARALVASTLEGNTLYRDAFRMLGFSKLETFQELGSITASISVQLFGSGSSPTTPQEPSTA